MPRGVAAEFVCCCFRGRGDSRDLARIVRASAEADARVCSPQPVLLHLSAGWAACSCHVRRRLLALDTSAGASPRTWLSQAPAAIIPWGALSVFVQTRPTPHTALSRGCLHPSQLRHPLSFWSLTRLRTACSFHELSPLGMWDSIQAMLVQPESHTGLLSTASGGPCCPAAPVCWWWSRSSLG